MSSSPPPPKTIILTFDGTDNEFCDTNTNVIRLFSLLQRGEPWKQVVYYQPGIGTWMRTSVAPPKYKAELLKPSDQILDGYRFLMRNYRVGDKVGLLINYNDQQIEFAYKRYLDTSEGGDDHNFTSRRVLMGPRDTVSSIGLHRPHLPYTSENNAVKILRQALALDERRVKYKPDLWSVVPEASGEQAFPARGEAVTNVLESLYSSTKTQLKDAEPGW
ncbi:hypothetical protein FS837_012854 [Tulasnella sp. UAMH 9824]|nr:hypothetical protein FS837_012854 [Tulasnella sp. UAMH 9824]